MDTPKRRMAVAMPGGLGAGVGAALVMMLVMAILRFTTNTISIPELMEESLIRLTGGQIESFFINNLGVGGKALLLVSIVEGTLLIGGLLGVIFTRVWPVSRAASGWRWFSGLLYGLILGAFLNVVFLPLVGQGLFGADALQATAPPEIAQSLYGSTLAPFGVPVPVNMFLLSIVFGLALVALLPWRRVVPASAPMASKSVAMADAQGVGRRDFVKALGGGAVALIGGAVLWAGIKSALAPPPLTGLQVVDNGQPGGNSQGGTTGLQPSTSEPTQAGAAGTAQPGGNGTHTAQMQPTPDMTPVSSTRSVPPGFENVKPMLVPEVTPVESFYITTKNFVDPTVDGNSWKLNFKGLVDNPYSITLKDLQALPASSRSETLECISNQVSGSLISNGTWKGANFGDMIRKAKPKSGVVDVVVRAADGYSDSFSLDVALNNDCLLVYDMNGKPLTQRHGYPARLLVPGIFGMKNCKWLTDVELVNSDYKGYWQQQGWNDAAPYLTMSRIDYPDKDSIPAQPIYIGGISFAGNRGIKRVEVSTDGGKSWNDATLRDPMSKNSWVLWTYPWKPAPGSYTIQARATDGTGQVQTATQRDTYPDGATGYPTRQVRVG